jgi:multiple sugar transport system substrate-binding protein
MTIQRRTLLQSTAAIGATAPSLLAWARAWAADNPFTPEKGATLRLLRASTFLPAEGETFAGNVAAFTAATGVTVTIDNVNQDDLVSKSALAVQIASGPDLIWTQNTTPHLFADKLVEVTDLATYLGDKYGGWYPVCVDYGMQNGRWICIPVFVVGTMLNYRISWINQAGFEKVPADTANFLKLCQALKRIGHPAGFSFGHAVGDANFFAYWLLWTHGGRMTDEVGNVVLASPQTLQALDYAVELYPAMIDGVSAWMDINNNRAFLAGQVSMTNNGISIYTEAKRSVPAIAADMDHAPMPIGPAGVAAEQNRIDPMMILGYTKYPNAAKALTAFAMERAQYERLVTNSVGFISQTLKGYADNPVWHGDPKIAPYGRATEATRAVSWPMTPNAKSAAALASFLLVDMFATAATGTTTPKAAMDRAQRAAEKIYKT